MPQNFRLLDDGLETWLTEEADEDEQASWLILSPHPDSSVHWIVQCLDSGYYFEFEDFIGKYRAVSPDALDDFMELADQLGYQVAFAEDPTPLLDAQARLDDPPPFELNSPFKDTIGGFLPFQLREFNRLKDKEYGLAVWSTGAGKTALAAALTKYHLDDIDLAFITVKRHNRINTARKFERLLGLGSLVVTGPKKWRERSYNRALEFLERGEPCILILNYEKYRDDFTAKYETDEGRPFIDLTEWGEAFFPDRELLFVWDEMPMKLKNRGSQLYAGVCNCLYDTKPPQIRADKFRPKRAWHYMLNATPIEQDPSDVFNCLRLMDKAKTFGPVKQFEDEYVKSWNPFNEYEPYAWHKLDKMHLKIAHCLSMVDKTDPEIAAMFPEMIEEARAIEWHDDDRKIYDTITKRVKSAFEDEEAEEVNPLALMLILQMMCDAPSMLNDSARLRQEFEDELVEFMEGDENEFPSTKGSELALELIDRIGTLSDDHHAKLDEH